MGTVSSEKCVGPITANIQQIFSTDLLEMEEQARAKREMCSVVLQYCCLHRGSREIALVVFPVEKGLDTGVPGTVLP